MLPVLLPPVEGCTLCDEHARLLVAHPVVNARPAHGEHMRVYVCVYIYVYIPMCTCIRTHSTYAGVVVVIAVVVVATDEQRREIVFAREREKDGDIVPYASWYRRTAQRISEEGNQGRGSERSPSIVGPVPLRCAQAVIRGYRGCRSVALV